MISVKNDSSSVAGSDRPAAELAPIDDGDLEGVSAGAGASSDGGGSSAANDAANQAANAVRGL